MTIAALKPALFGILGITGAMLFFDVSERVIFGARPSNRLVVYAMQRELRQGMSREDGAEIIAKHQTKDVRVRWNTTDSDATLYLWTPLGLFHDGGCQLSGRFVEGRLVSAKIRGTEGPDERFADAPPDID